MTFRTSYPFVRMLLPMVMGILIGLSFPNQIPAHTILWITFIFFFILIAINTVYKKYNLYKFKFAIALLFYLFFFSFGIATTILNTDFLSRNYFANKKAKFLKVKIDSEVQQSGKIIRFEASATETFYHRYAQKVKGKLMVAVMVDSLKPIKLEYGDEMIIPAKYDEIEPPYNPAEFDFKAWLANKNVYHQTFISQNQLVVTGKNVGNPIISYALKLRKKQVDVYRKLVKDNEAFAVASTLILGYRADLSKETLSAYSKTGTIHALSVSGSHVAIIYFCLAWIFSFLNKSRLLKILKFIIISGLIWAYALLTGLSPSVVRAAIMISVFIFSETFTKNRNSYNILAFAAFCQLVYSPFLLKDVGFQLSYISVFGLIYLQPKIYKWLYVKNKLADKIWQLIALSLAAQIVTFPLSIYYFHQFPVYFILGNLFISLPLIVIMYFGIFILLFPFGILGQAFEKIIVFTNDALKWMSDLPFSTFSSIWLAKIELILLILGIGFLVYALVNYQKRTLAISLVILIVLQSISFYKMMNFTKQCKIVGFSLRKNYAIAFVQGEKAFLLTDLLKNDKNFDFFVKPALDEMQIQQTDFITWEADYKSDCFQKSANQLVFKQTKFLLYDNTFNRNKIINQPKFDKVIIHKNPYKSIAQLNKEIRFSTLLIDASNKDYRIKKYCEEARKLNIENYVLKKQKALIIDL